MVGFFDQRRAKRRMPSRIIMPAKPDRNPAAEVTEPGVITHGYGDRFSLGEPDGTRSERVEALSKLLIAAGLKAPIRPRIRDEIWVKLWGNLCFNPVSALTGATLATITGRPDLRALCRAMMVEAQAVAARSYAVAKKGRHEDRDADLLRCLDRRLRARIPLAQEPRDVLDDHDGIVHKQTEGDHEAHDRQLVDGIASRVEQHHPDGE
jgi:hypothetical protein